MRSIEVRYILATGVCLGLLIAGCKSAPPPAPSPALRFVDVAPDAGLGAFKHVNGSENKFWFPEQMGAGGGFIDYDGDGWEHLVLVGGGRLSPAGPANVQAVWLFQNNQDGSFSDVTAATGLANIRAYGTGIAAADYDNDGDQDFLLTTFGRDLLFRNDAAPNDNTKRNFTETGLAAGLGDINAWSSSALFLDADKDGDLDLYTGGYARWSLDTDVECFRANGDPDYCPPATYSGDHSHYYENLGDGSFKDQTLQVGLGGTPGKSLAVAEWDFNQDTWPDFIVVNDGEPDLLYINDTDGTFTEKGLTSGIALGEHGEARAGMGVDVGIVDSTGLPSVFVGNFSSEMIGVYRQTPNGWFSDRAAASGIGRYSLTTLAFGVRLFDADLDTDLDLFVANGHVYLNPLDGSKYEQPPHLFINKGDGKFADSAIEIGGVMQEPMVARAIATADYDRDGDVDLLVTENNGRIRLLRNDSNAGHSVRIRLKGQIDLKNSNPVKSNPDALGAQLTAYLPTTRMIRRVRTGSGYLSNSEKVSTFGLGPYEKLDSLSIQWPDGTRTSFTDLQAGFEYTFLEGQGLQLKESLQAKVNLQHKVDLQN